MYDQLSYYNQPGKLARSEKEGMVHLPTNVTLRNMQQVSSRCVKLILNIKVTNVYTHQKTRWRTLSIASTIPYIVRNKVEETYPLSGYYTDTHLAKSILPTMLHSSAHTDYQVFLEKKILSFISTV